ncbi:hypothetical protein BDBG_04870 [Blastomyces gilchristii SLH14081]|uniref:Uncharacterized protein n=1 Tax=Blastomyces gilchristii (strain SLH14081) TaxID=559298 RepID=A0A179UQD6_BLAGS|nr:uncharacterized protein BDBG_04870 [Blastomyces gilchristii SLH14081]OAT08612.1 hypothetical protein BDBG_04870 [Blastomyces gilchristii SLH14081]
MATGQSRAGISFPSHHQPPPPQLLLPSTASLPLLRSSWFCFIRVAHGQASFFYFASLAFCCCAKMGIPLHWEPPARSAAASNGRAKADPLAPSRSTIRRQRTLRRPHRNNNGSRSASSNRPAGYVPSRPSMPQWVESLSREALGDSATSSTATARGSAMTTSEPGASRYTPSQDNETRLDWPASSSYSSSQTRRDLGDQIPRTTALRYYSSPGGRRIRIPRESSLRFEMLHPPSWSHSTERSRRSELSSDATANSRLESRLGEIVSFSPRFAPAYPPRSNERAMVSSDSYDPNMPLLRRVGHRSVADTSDLDATRPRHIIDGLGDRDRSLSPGGDSQHDDEDSHYHDHDDDDDDDDDDEPNMWESLFTTITPDQHLPSLDSSFTSATASASTAPSRNSANSSQSTLPSSLGANNSNPSRRPGVFPPLESFTDHNNHCDFFSSSEDSETEPDSDNEHIPTWRLMQYDDPMPISSSVSAIDDAIRRSEQQQQLRRRYQENLLGITQTIRAVVAETPANRNGDHNTTTNINTSTNATSSFTSSSTTPTSINVSFGQSSSMGDLQQVQTIIDQLTRRQDIGDDWWAAVGLSRNLGRGVTDVPARNGSGNSGSGDAEGR